MRRASHQEYRERVQFAAAAGGAVRSQTNQILKIAHSHFLNMR